MAQLSGIGIALRNQITRTINDTTMNGQWFVSLLAALDNYYGISNSFVRSNDVSGEKIQVDVRTGKPTVAGVLAVTGSVGSLEQSAQSNTSFKAGTMLWSHYQMREDIRASYVQHIDSNPKSVVPYIQKVSAAAADATLQALSTDILPALTLTPARASGGTNGAPAEDKIMALYHPLLVGRDGNDTGAVTPSTFTYLDVDFNANTEYRAVNYGTDIAPFGNMTLSTLRRKILMPMRNRGSKPDMVLTDSDIYDYALTVAEGKVVITQDDKMEFGGTWAKYGGLWWMTDPQEDAKIAAGSNFHQAAVLQSKDWHFIFNGNLKNFKVIDNPKTSALLTMLGYFSCALVCEASRMQGHAFNVTP